MKRRDGLGMDAARKERLVVLMTAMAAGDRAAIFTVLEEFGGELAAAVRRASSHLRVELSAQDVRDLAMDLALVLYDLAASWDPAGGALPWVWAERRVGALVTGFVGQHADELDEAAIARIAQVDRPEAGLDDREVLNALAALSPACRLFVDALERVASPRNFNVVLSFRLQRVLGDPSPAVTVGHQYDLRPDAVRQIVHRARLALRRLAHSDPKFDGLRDLGWLG